jgi:hypothetical protein
MKFVKVDEVPQMRHKKNELKAHLDEFMRMRTKIVKVEWADTYRSADAAQMGLSRSVKTWVLPIDVRKVGDEVYLIRRDM